ncbi:MAG: heat-inducible transcriptional repressor HrcA [Clostridia bacterium]
MPDLDIRKIRILQAIIDDYILTAAPVGSRTISKHPDIGLSSATIRNEMSDLEELGYLEQPHTSAGRVPSDKAYRLYVNSIMQKSRLSADEMQYIQRHFSNTLDEVERIVRQTAWVLSNITNYTSMVLKPQIHTVKLKHIQLVPVSEGKALLVIVTDAGITRDAIIRIPHDMDVTQLERLSHILTAKLTNSRLDNVSNVLIPELAAQIGEHREFLNAMLETVQRSMQPTGGNVELSGKTNILNYPEYNDIDKAKSFLAAIEEQDVLYKMLTDASKVEFSITIGNENNSTDMKDCSVVTATYKVGDVSMGSMGIIGPTRMDYSRVLAVLGYIGKSLSDILTNMFEEEHD